MVLKVANEISSFFITCHDCLDVFLTFLYMFLCLGFTATVLFEGNEFGIGVSLVQLDSSDNEIGLFIGANKMVQFNY